MMLPSRWMEIQFSECVATTSTIDPRKYPSEDFDLFSVPSHSQLRPETIKGAEIGSSKQEVRENDVLICKIVPHIRRSWVVPRTSGRRQIASGEWIVLREHGFDPAFLRTFLISDGFHEQFMRTVSGVGGSLMRARPAEAGKIKIPAPPLAEQSRIVVKLEALTARLARARADLDGVELLTKKLRSSALSMQISTSGGEVVRLGDVLEDVRYGTSKKCEYNGGATPVLRIPNIQKGRIATEDLKAADFDASERQKLALVSGDVLIIRSNGSLDLVGKSAIIDERAAGMLYAGYLIRLRVSKKRLRPEYLQAFLSAPDTRDILENLARSTSGVNNINAEQLKDLMIPLPSLERQDEAVTQVKLVSAHSDRLEAEASKAKMLLDRLASAILGKAFKGELVPQDPNDEPADVLLARIRAQREAVARVPGVRGGRRKVG